MSERDIGSANATSQERGPPVAHRCPQCQFVVIGGLALRHLPDELPPKEPNSRQVLSGVNMSELTLEPTIFPTDLFDKISDALEEPKSASSDDSHGSKKNL